MIYFYTNTKMFKNCRETEEYLCQLKELLQDIPRSKMELSVMPPFTALYKAREILEKRKDSSGNTDGTFASAESENSQWNLTHSAESQLQLCNIILGAQNVCGESEREYTGEISASMLKEAGVQLVMVGHSERRRKLGETDEMINRKIHKALEQEIIVLLSVSETLFEKQSGIPDETLRIQLKKALAGVKAEQLPLVRILYEPAWAVGASGQKPTAEYAEQKHLVIKKCLSELYGLETGMKIPVIYGGSVNEENACEIITQPHVDGLGIGRSAWDAQRFNRIIRMAMKIKQ